MTSTDNTVPISPPTAVGSGGRFELPAYVSNGLVGLRIPELPLIDGFAMVSGFSGEHPEKGIEAAARAPFPLGGDLVLDGVALSSATYRVEIVDQAHDFASGELTSRFVFVAAGTRAEVEVVTFCSRSEPTIVCQRIEVAVDRACHLTVMGGLLTEGIEGAAKRRHKGLPGRREPVDGALLWSSAGDVSTCGLAYVTRLEGQAEVERSHTGEPAAFMTSHALHAAPDRRLRLVQITSIVPGVMHLRPDMEAARLVAMNDERGFDELRRLNRAEWRRLWMGRILVAGAEPRWQAMADAAFYYFNASVHSASPASTSIFGLATWTNYHYYYGHVMWDIETFVVPVLTLLQPQAAAALLEFRYRTMSGAHFNARLNGRRGLQFPWESAPTGGEEAAPLPGTAAWHEDHVSLDVALAFVFHADVTGDRDFLKSRAWPVLSGVATWLETRVTATGRGYEILRSMGIAERQQPSDNTAYTNVAAKQVLRAAIRIGGALGEAVNPVWAEIADSLVIPERDGAVVSYDGYGDEDEKAETPDPLMTLFPMGYGLSPEAEMATLDLYLGKAEAYAGNPMLSALLGVWAAWAGRAARAADLMEQGYAAFVTERFAQTLEYRADRHPDQPMAGPFFANIGGFLMGLMLGFPALIPDDGPPEGWSRRSVTLPAGWTSIKVERLWVRGRPARLEAIEGAARALLSPAPNDGGRADVDPDAAAPDGQDAR